MNEKLKEIAEKAKIQMVSEPRLQEFAELIIEECINAVQTVDRKSLIYTTYDAHNVEGSIVRAIERIRNKFI